MQSRDLLTLSIRNVVRAGTRTTLCVLAICIGIASVSMIMTLGNTAGDAIQGELDQIGIRGVIIYPTSGGSLSDTALQVFASSEAIQTYMPIALTAGSARLRNIRSNVGIIGVDERLSQMFSLRVLHGALPTKGQISSAEKVIVIDEFFAKKAYQRTNVVGKKVVLSLNGVTESLEICAVIASQSSGLSALFSGNLPYLLYLPYSTLTNLSPSIAPDKIIALPSSDNANFDILTRKLTKHTGLQFHHENMSQYLNSVGKISTVLTALISGVAGISILVGGIGVMNAMFSSIDARTKEIGIYRALGAKRRDIVKMILLEAIILCLSGGILGIATQCSITFLVNQLIGITLHTQPAGMLIGIVCATICGISVGWIPAMRAANLDPIQAIRKE